MDTDFSTSVAPQSYETFFMQEPMRSANVSVAFQKGGGKTLKIASLPHPKCYSKQMRATIFQFTGAFVSWGAILTSHALAQPVLTINGVNANYTTTHVFVDEVAGLPVPLTVVFQPNAASLT